MSILFKCFDCSKSDKFFDLKDIRNAGWEVLGWNTNDNEPVGRCDKCAKIEAEKPKRELIPFRREP